MLATSRVRFGTTCAIYFTRLAFAPDARVFMKFRITDMFNTNYVIFASLLTLQISNRYSWLLSHYVHLLYCYRYVHVVWDLCLSYLEIKQTENVFRKRVEKQGVDWLNRLHEDITPFI